MFAWRNLFLPGRLILRSCRSQWTHGLREESYATELKYFYCWVQCIAIVMDFYLADDWDYCWNTKSIVCRALHSSLRSDLLWFLCLDSPINQCFHYWIIKIYYIFRVSLIIILYIITLHLSFKKLLSLKNGKRWKGLLKRWFFFMNTSL